VRIALAEMFNHPEHLIHFRTSDVAAGSAFRGAVPEEILVSGWPCSSAGRCSGSRIAEHFMATNHSRQQEHDIEVGFQADGKIVAMVDRYTYDLGAYLRTNGMVVPMLTRALLPGPYKIPNYECEGLIVLTNKTPVGSYRGPGRFEANFVRERVVDLIAGRLGLDPADVRRRNFLTPEDMPYNVGTGSFNEETIFDDGDFPTVFETALERRAMRRSAREQAELRREGRYVGVGIGCLIEKTGSPESARSRSTAPDRWSPSTRRRHAGGEPRYGAGAGGRGRVRHDPG
jgi:CO/xanthine dehydrogenase Mo-binding subunit